MWGAELLILPALDIVLPPVWRWGAAEIAIDGLHHAVYAAATSVTFELLDAHAAAPR